VIKVSEENLIAGLRIAGEIPPGLLVILGAVVAARAIRPGLALHCLSFSGVFAAENIEAPVHEAIAPCVSALVPVVITCCMQIAGVFGVVAVAVVRCSLTVQIAVAVLLVVADLGSCDVQQFFYGIAHKLTSVSLF